MKKQTAGRDVLGAVAPKFAELNDDVLFGQVWSRSDRLSLRDRSIVTVTALITKGIFDNSLKYHLANARNNGVTVVEMAELLTHLAFYAGWPNAWGAFAQMKEVYAGGEPNDGSDKAAFDRANIFGQGQENTAYAQYFVGTSWLNPLTPRGTVPFMANVTFEPGCRNNWHVHRAARGGGQILLCVAGRGWYQEEGKDPAELTPGQVVVIPPNVRHWHGAARDSWFSHVSVEVPGEKTSNEWLEPVESELYRSR